MVVGPDVLAVHDDGTIVLVVGGCGDRGGDGGGTGVVDGGASENDTGDKTGYERVRSGVGALGCCCCWVAKTGDGEGPGVDGCVGINVDWG